MLVSALKFRLAESFGRGLTERVRPPHAIIHGCIILMPRSFCRTCPRIMVACAMGMAVASRYAPVEAGVIWGTSVCPSAAITARRTCRSPSSAASASSARIPIVLPCKVAE